MAITVIRGRKEGRKGMEGKEGRKGIEGKEREENGGDDAYSMFC